MRPTLLVTILAAVLTQVQVIPPPPPPPPQATVLPDGRVIVDSPFQPASQAPPAQPIAQTGEGVIEGMVKRTDNGEPVRDVQILLSAPPSGTPPVPHQLSAITDGSGTFVFRNMPAGNYSVRATRENHFGPVTNGQAPTFVTASADVDPLKKTTTVTLNMMPGGTISGSVRDPRGQPSSNAAVEALRLTYRDGRRTLTTAKQVRTDDRGDFRLWGLPPGEFYLRAGGGLGARGGTSGTYYPGVLDPQFATLIKVRGGDEVPADLRIQPTTAVRISGTYVNTIPELTIDPIGFLLMPHDPTKLDEGNAGNLIPNEAQDRTNGRFEITTTRPGVFNLMPVVPLRRDPNGPPTATSITSGNPQYFTGRVTVDVRDKDVEGVTLTVSRGSDLDLHVTLGPVPATTLQNLRIALGPRDSASTPLTTHVSRARPVPADGNLKFLSVPPGNYALYLQLPLSGAYIANLRQGARSIYDSGVITVEENATDPVEVVLNNGGGRIDGTVDGAEGKPAGTVRLILVPQGARRGNPIFYKRSTPANGRFTLMDVAPGEYKLYAMEDLLPGADESVEFMAQFDQQGRQVSVTAGGSITSITVPLIRSK